jgi:uncharacterized membrane protein YdjX (TVP38/TMEM64 family)
MNDMDLDVVSSPAPALGLLSRKQGVRQYIGPKRIILLLIFVSLCAVAWRWQRTGEFDPVALRALLERHPVAAVAIFLAVYAISVLTALPTLPLNLAAGLFWGPLLGGVISMVGTACGAIGAFFAARLLLGQPLARRFDSRLITWLQQEFDRKGWRLIAFLRLNPIFPTGPLNYILGLTSISARTYSWATPVFLLLPCIAVALIGHEVGAFVSQGRTADWLGTMIAISAAITFLIGLRYGARYLRYTRGNLS